MLHGVPRLVGGDAYGSDADPRATHRGKAIYDPFLTAALPRLRKGSAVIVHNLERDAADLAPFLKQIDAVSSSGAELTTYNGLGVYRI